MTNLAVSSDYHRTHEITLEAVGQISTLLMRQGAVVGVKIYNREQKTIRLWVLDSEANLRGEWKSAARLPAAGLELKTLAAIRSTSFA